jgi:hypothetical protein
MMAVMLRDYEFVRADVMVAKVQVYVGYVAGSQFIGSTNTLSESLDRFYRHFTMSALCHDTPD